MQAWIGLVAIAVVISAIFWFNGRTPEKVARNSPSGGGSHGGGAGLGAAAGMDKTE